MSRKVLCFGELLLRLAAPASERLLQSPRLDICVGGAEANVAVSLARLGHEVAMVSVVADNALGQAAVGELRRHGVDTRSVRAGAGRMGLYFLEAGAIQRPSRVLYDRAGSAFARADADSYDWPALLDGVSWLHLSGVTPALGASGAAAAIAAARAARQAGVRICFDGNFRSSLWQEWGVDPAPILHELMSQADVLVADHRDIAVALATQVDPYAADGGLARAAELAFAAFPNLQRLACTQRQQRNVDHHALSAALFHRDGSAISTPAYELPSIVDRIGTGDAFAAGLLHGLLHEMSDEAGLHFALAAASLKHSVPGDFNLVDAQEIEDLLSGNGFHVRR
ncbi:pfkB carbohydrate kinase family protein [Lysobacter capsici]|uniref:sugar kinase n=1 Tax=Lysobacter capsici TaxID=435897 RepID=UPI0007165FBA|nr:sugar kinase [Lysobacter capsici]ALN84825.1 pfkB carbohydrate kinase family protein [Lysobacter capsici]